MLPPSYDDELWAARSLFLSADLYFSFVAKGKLQDLAWRWIG